MKDIKKMEKAIGKDAVKDAEGDVDKVVKEFEANVNKLVEDREKEILTV